MRNIFNGIRILVNGFRKFSGERNSERNFRISNDDLIQSNSLLKKTAYTLDPIETRFLQQLLNANKSGISVFEINRMFNLDKLSEANQRVRRHIIIKEINLKLFMITQIRECVIRVPSISDRRMKFYYLLENAKSDQLNNAIFNSLAD